MTIDKVVASLRTLAFLAVISSVLSGLAFIPSIYQPALAADLTKPTISITAPSNGATVSGAVQWTVKATDNVGVNNVMFFIDGRTYAVSFAAPYFTNVATAALSNGAHTWLAIAYDSAGNEARASISVTTNNPDTTGPMVTILKPLTGTTVSGTIDYRARATDINGATKVEFYVDSTLVGTDTTPEYDAGTNTISQYAVSWNTASKPNGSHTLLAKGYDKYNNVGTRSITVTVSNSGGGSDTSPPPAPVISSPASGTSTNDSTPTFTGTAEAYSTVKLYDGSSLIATTTASSSGTWSATSTTLANGVHSITAKATDKAGNTSLASTAKSITIDTLVPSAPKILSPTSGATTSDSTPTFSGTAEASSTIKLYDGSSTTPIATTTASTSGSWSATPSTSMSSAGHTINSKATDKAGNTSPASSVTITISASISTLSAPVILTPASGTVTKDSTPTFTGTATASSTVKLYDGSILIASTTATSAGSWSATPTAALSNGVHSITAKATNLAGSTSAASSAKSITVDTISPSTSITSPSEGATVRATIVVSVTATDNIHLSKVELYVDGSLRTTDTTSGYSFSLDTSALKNGSHTLLVKAFDGAGNTATDSVTIKVVG